MPKVNFIFLSIFLCLCLYKGDSANFRQEGAKVLYTNPKYVKELSVFTSRRNRHSPYLTTINCTTLQPWSNNVSIVIEYHNVKVVGEAVRLEYKLCEFMNIGWAKAWMKKYSDLDYRKCPIPEGSYHFNQVKIPPENFPLPLSNGDHHLKITYMINKTKEKLLIMELALRFENPK